VLGADSVDVAFLVDAAAPGVLGADLFVRFGRTAKPSSLFSHTDAMERPCIHGSGGTERQSMQCCTGQQWAIHSGAPTGCSSGSPGFRD
jgi:hypothetical protein